MAGFVARFVLKKVFKEKLENKFGTEDPFFEQVPATRLDGKPSGKTKKVRKALPPGISEHDAKILTKVKRRAFALDRSFGNCCGLKFGWGSVIGIVPVVGDVADLLLALMVISTAKKVDGGLPSATVLSMYLWAFIDFVVGFVPLVGDVADAMVRANERNAIALEDVLRKKGVKNLKAQGLPVPADDPSDPDAWERHHSEPAIDHVTAQPSRHANMAADPTPTKPTEAVVHDNQAGGSGRGFFGKKSRPADVEMGKSDMGSPQKSKSTSRR